MFSSISVYLHFSGAPSLTSQANQNMMHPIRINVQQQQSDVPGHTMQQQQQNQQQPGQGLSSLAGGHGPIPWSSPSTPNSMADSTSGNSSGYESQQGLGMGLAGATAAQLRLLQQAKALSPQKFPPQSPVPPGAPQGPGPFPGFPGFDGKQLAGLPRNGFPRGLPRHPFFQQQLAQATRQRQRNASESSGGSSQGGAGPSTPDARPPPNANMQTPDSQHMKDMPFHPR